jgi:hypothetical protein
VSWASCSGGGGVLRRARVDRQMEVGARGRGRDR